MNEIQEQLHIFDEHYREQFKLLLDCAEKFDEETKKKIIAIVRLAIKREKEDK